jgi:hypothetical protein
MAAIDQSMVSNILNATLPTGASGAPGSFTAVGGTAMKVRLNSAASTASAAGTELTGSGYTAGGTAVPGASTASSAGSSVTLPHGGALSWTNASGGSWSIVSLDITSSAATRCWFGNFTGQPISVANGNTFQIAADAITVSLT